MGTAAMGIARPKAAGAGRTGLVAQMLSLSPLALLLAIAADPDVNRLFDGAAAPQRVAITGLALVVAFTLLWTVLGALVIRRSSSPLARSIALLVFTIPATVLAVVGPWLSLVQLRP